MYVNDQLKKYAVEYIRGERTLPECSIPGIKWGPCRKALLASHKYYNSSQKTPSLLLEKKRAESRFWLETGIPWPDLSRELS